MIRSCRDRSVTVTPCPAGESRALLVVMPARRRPVDVMSVSTAIAVPVGDNPTMSSGDVMGRCPRPKVAVALGDSHWLLLSTLPTLFALVR
jgi:hypothetical protein